MALAGEWWEGDAEQVDDLFRAVGQRIQSSLPLKDRKWMGRTYAQCLDAKEIIDWLISEHLCNSRKHAVKIGSGLQKRKILVHVWGSHTKLVPFTDTQMFFRLCRVPFSAVSDVTTDEIQQAAALFHPPDDANEDVTGSENSIPVALTTPTPPGSRLLLVGLGPAGLAVCRSLSKVTHITVVEPKEFVEYTPSVLNGLVNPDAWRALVVSTEDALRAACGKRVTWNWQRGYVKVIRPGSVDIQPVGEGDGRCVVAKFDGAIIATGTSNGIWKAGGMPLVACGAMALDATGCTLAGREEQLRLEKARLELAAEKARRQDMPDSENALKATGHPIEKAKKVDTARPPEAAEECKPPEIIVVGGGIVGVELASEIVTSFPDLRDHVTLVNRGERILSGGPASASKAASDWFAANGVNVLTGESATQFLEELPSEEPPHIIRYMCVGARPILPQFDPPARLDSKGYLLCDAQFRVLAAGSGGSLWADGRVFACGDCAEIRGLEGQVNKTIYPAETNARKVAYNMEKIVFGRHLGLKSACKGLDPTVTSLGPDAAVMVVNGITTMTGKPASLVKHMIEQSKVDEKRGGVGGALLWKLVPHI